MKKVVLLSLFASLLLLQGCVGFGETRPAKLDPKMVSNQGVIFGSISRPNIGRGFHRYTLYFKSSGSDKTLPVSVNAYVRGYSLFSNYTDPDEVVGELDRWFFVKVLPPGDYELVKFEAFFNQGGMATSSWAPKKDMRCRFTVKAGENVYVGEHSFIHQQAKTLIGITVPSSPVYAIGNSEANDLNLARTIFPSVDWAPYSTPDFVGGDVWMDECGLGS